MKASERNETPGVMDKRHGLSSEQKRFRTIVFAIGDLADAGRISADDELILTTRAAVAAHAGDAGMLSRVEDRIHRLASERNETPDCSRASSEISDRQIGDDRG